MYDSTVQGKYPSLFASIKHSILIKRKFKLLRPHSGEALYLTREEVLILNIKITFAKYLWGKKLKELSGVIL